MPIPSGLWQRSIICHRLQFNRLQPRSS